MRPEPKGSGYLEAETLLLEDGDAVLRQGDGGGRVASGEDVVHLGGEGNGGGLLVVVGEDEDFLVVAGADGDVDALGDVGEDGSEAGVGEHPGGGALHGGGVE